MEHNLASIPRADILVVDDMPDNIRLLSTMLLKQGYSVRKALNGRMALTTAQIVPPDLILLDINMPEMNGYEVCKQLKENAQTLSIPVIFLSALDDVFDKVQAFQVGGIDFITKPFYFEEVIVRIQTQLKIRDLQSQLQAQNSKLQEALNEVKKTDSKLTQKNVMVRTEHLADEDKHKLSNNPNFSSGNFTQLYENVQKLLYLINTYQTAYPNPTPVVRQALEQVD